MPTIRQLIDGKTTWEIDAQASEGAKHVGRHIADPFGETKDLFDNVHQKKMEYELAKQDLVHQTAPARAVLDRVSQIHNLDQAPVSMNTQPMQPNPYDTEDTMGMGNGAQTDPLAQDPAMAQEVNQGKAGMQMDPASRVPANMAQTPGQLNMNRPSKAGFQPGVSPGPAESVRPGKMGMPQPGQANVGQKAGFPSPRPGSPGGAPQGAPGAVARQLGPQPKAQPQQPQAQASPAASKPKGAGKLPGAKGPGDPKVQTQVKKAQNNSKTSGESNGRQIKIQVHADAGMIGGARNPMSAAIGLEKIRSCNDGKMKAYGTSEGVMKEWDTRGRGRKEAEQLNLFKKPDVIPADLAKKSTLARDLHEVHDVQKPSSFEEGLKKQQQLQTRDLGTIAREIRKDWKNVNYAAKPYLDALSTMSSVKDNYGMDSGHSVVAYFLSNASSWKGETAKRVKGELKKMLK